MTERKNHPCVYCNRRFFFHQGLLSHYRHKHYGQWTKDKADLLGAELPTGEPRCPNCGWSVGDQPKPPDVSGGVRQLQHALVQYAETLMDQWEMWRLNTNNGHIYVTITYEPQPGTIDGNYEAFDE